MTLLKNNMEVYMAKYDAYYKDMSESGLKRLEEYGFERKESIYDGTIYEIHYEQGELWLDVEYIPESMTSDEFDTDKKVIGNGEFHLDDDCRYLSVGNMETICRLYKDGLIEFKEMPGSAYQMQYGGIYGK